MPKYKVGTKIESNVPADKLYYSLALYRENTGTKQYILKETTPTVFLDNYITEDYETIDISNDYSTLYLMEIKLYRKILNNSLKSVCINKIIRIYDLNQSITDNYYRKLSYKESYESTAKIENDIKVVNCKITQEERVYIASGIEVGSQYDPFEKKKIEKSLLFRLAIYRRPHNYFQIGVNYNAPSQKESSLCGPAAFFYCLLRDRPDLYEQVVWDLWETGSSKLGNLIIKPSRVNKRPTNYVGKDIDGPSYLIMDGIDWITLASLVDSSNLWFSYSSPEKNTKDAFAGITLPSTLASWFEQASFKNVIDYTAFSRHTSLEKICQLNKLVGNKNHVITLINAGGMLDTGSNTFFNFKNHWIVWESKLCLEDKTTEVTLLTHETEIVSLKLFSWGAVDYQLKEGLTLKAFLKASFGALVVSKLT